MAQFLLILDSPLGTLPLPPHDLSVKVDMSEPTLFVSLTDGTSLDNSGMCNL